MGQAKQRGTFEQRRMEAEARMLKQLEARGAERIEREAAMTPAQKEARRKARTFLTMTSGLIAGMTSNA